ncbi:MAG: TPM domain-containing protein [Bdellovibrionales bacterium]|nr:TPM domain-containing protein [Bdellovibrionales bacterium]
MLGLKTLLASLALVVPLAQAAPRAIPALRDPVLDEAGLLAPSDREALNNELRAYKPRVEMAIWIVQSLQGEPVESLSIRAAETWKLGTAKEDNGLILLVALDDRTVRIEVGQGLEGAIPDALAGRIIDQIIQPSFRRELYASGLMKASRALFGLAGGDPANLPKLPEQRPSVPLFGIVLFLFLIVLSFLSRLTGGRRSRSGIYWGGGGFGGGGFGGGSFGGGGWGGGGGGFSGGGSSGKW